MACPLLTPLVKVVPDTGLQIGVAETATGYEETSLIFLPLIQDELGKAVAREGAAPGGYVAGRRRRRRLRAPVWPHRAVGKQG